MFSLRNFQEDARENIRVVTGEHKIELVCDDSEVDIDENERQPHNVEIQVPMLENVQEHEKKKINALELNDRTESNEQFRVDAREPLSDSFIIR